MQSSKQNHPLENTISEPHRVPCHVFSISPGFPLQWYTKILRPVLPFHLLLSYCVRKGKFHGQRSLAGYSLGVTNSWTRPSLRAHTHKGTCHFKMHIFSIYFQTLTTSDTTAMKFKDVSIKQNSILKKSHQSVITWMAGSSIFFWKENRKPILIFENENKVTLRCFLLNILIDFKRFNNVREIMMCGMWINHFRHNN